MQLQNDRNNTPVYLTTLTCLSGERLIFDLGLYESSVVAGLATREGYRPSLFVTTPYSRKDWKHRKGTTIMEVTNSTERYDQARAFLQALHTHFDLETFQTVATSPTCNDKAQIIHGTLQDRFEQLTDINKQGSNIYVMVNRGDGKGRTKYNVTEIVAYFIAASNRLLDKVKTCEFAPHIITAVSETKFQAFWKIIPVQVTNSNRYEKIEHFKKFQAGLAAKFSSDPFLTDIARTCDLPGFFNHKNVSQVNLDVRHLMRWPGSLGQSLQ